MATLLSLEYPNGRTFLAEVPEDVKPGAEFDLYGRRWLAVGAVPSRHAYRYVKHPPPRLLCRQTP